MQNERARPASGNIRREKQSGRPRSCRRRPLAGKRITGVRPAPLLMTRATKHAAVNPQVPVSRCKKLRSFSRHSFC